MTLYDRHGKQIKTNKPIMEEIAVQTLRDRYGSYPSHGLTPARLAVILKEADQGDVSRQSELFQEMEEKDGHLASVLQTRKFAPAGIDWEMLPASKDSTDVKIAEAAKEMFEYIENWDDALIDMQDAVGKGFSVCEIMWEHSEGSLWCNEIKWVHQKRFTFNGRERLLDAPRLLTDSEPVWGEELLPNKFIFHRSKARSGATARGGLLRPCAYMYLFKNYDVKHWLIFNELFSVPMRVGKYSPGTSKEDIDVLKRAVFNLGVDAAAVISDSTIIELLESKLRGDVSSFSDFIDFCDKSITKAVLGHAGLAEGTPGKLGSEEAALTVRQDLLEADCKSLARTIRTYLLQPWVVFNFDPQAGVPNFKFKYEPPEDVEKTARVYGILVKDAGFTNIGVKHIHERFGIPEPAKGEETLSAVIGSAEERKAEVLKNKQTKEFAEANYRDLITAQQEIDGLADNALTPLLPPLSKWGQEGGYLAPIYLMIESAESYEELQQKIAEAYKGIDMKQMNEILAQAIFMAELQGRSLGR